MKKIVLYGQILLVVLMAQSVNAGAPRDKDAFRNATEAEEYDIDQLSNQVDFFKIRTPVFVPTMAQVHGLFHNGLMTRRELRHWILMMEPVTKEEKTIVNALTAKYIPTTDTIALAKKRADRRTEIADKHAQKSKEKIESAKLARTQYEQLLQDKKDNRDARRKAKMDSDGIAQAKLDGAKTKSKNERLAKKSKKIAE
ncbi:MAG: hypothetical protein NTZ68_03845 [Candidatus Dependentiae bacterium]|nr:hypothetical protein [Candidatus Dependentiae bacterium]